MQIPCFFYKLFLLFYQSFLVIFSVVFQSCIIPDLCLIYMLIFLSIFPNSIFFFNSLYSLEACPCFLHSCLTFPFLQHIGILAIFFHINNLYKSRHIQPKNDNNQYHKVSISRKIKRTKT